VSGYLVHLACGHTGQTRGEPSVGTYISCWAVVAAAGGGESCQAQRKVTAAEPLP
jgi:hypothetical protein